MNRTRFSSTDGDGRDRSATRRDDERGPSRIRPIAASVVTPFDYHRRSVCQLVILYNSGDVLNRGMNGGWAMEAIGRE